MIRRSLFAVLGFVLLATLAGCETPSTRPSFPDIRFTSEPKLRLNVAAVDLQSDFHPTFQPPNVEHLFPVPPQRAAENWVRDRLEAAGGTKRLRVRITDASVKETELPRTQGISGTFTRDQAQRYDLRVEIFIELLGDRGIAERSISAEINAHQSVAEGITPNDRDQAWYDLTKRAMKDLDQSLEAKIRSNFGDYFH
jgi:hypothetical protein